MLIVKRGDLQSGSLYRGICSKCNCEVLVQESELREEQSQTYGGTYLTHRYCKCPTALCGGTIDLGYDAYYTDEEYAVLVAKYGPEV